MTKGTAPFIHALTFLTMFSAAPCASVAQVPHALTPGDFRLGPIREGTDSLIVRQRLGKPDSIRSEQASPDASAQLITWTYPHFRLLFTVLSGHGVAGVETTDSSIATHRGLRIGDSVARLKKLYGAPANTYQDTWDYQDPAGQLHVLRFTIRNGKVAAIYAGWILD